MLGETLGSSLGRSVKVKPCGAVTNPRRTRAIWYHVLIRNWNKTLIWVNKFSWTPSECESGCRSVKLKRYLRWKLASGRWLPTWMLNFIQTKLLTKYLLPQFLSSIPLTLQNQECVSTFISRMFRTAARSQFRPTNPQLYWCVHRLMFDVSMLVRKYNTLSWLWWFLKYNIYTNP